MLAGLSSFTLLLMILLLIVVLFIGFVVLIVNYYTTEKTKEKKGDFIVNHMSLVASKIYVSFWILFGFIFVTAGIQRMLYSIISLIFDNTQKYEVFNRSESFALGFFLIFVGSMVAATHFLMAKRILNISIHTPTLLTKFMLFISTFAYSIVHIFSVVVFYSHLSKFLGDTSGGLFAYINLANVSILIASMVGLITLFYVSYRTIFK